ncbi:MAG: hypothetical protein ABI557_21405, partial [Aureliella sp.]
MQGRLAKRPDAQQLLGLPVTLAIRQDQRFGGHLRFVAWMDGKADTPKTNRELVEACKTPEDFREMFILLGIHGKQWRIST